MLHVVVAARPPRELLDDVLRDLLGDVPAVDRSCPDCDRQHGKPVLDHPTLHVSTASSGGLSVVAVADVLVGVDVERADATRFEGFDEVVLAPGEVAATPHERAVLWTRKEAVLKATGEGLRTDPRTVDVTTPSDRWRFHDVEVPEGWVAVAAVLTGAAGAPPAARA